MSPIPKGPKAIHHETLRVIREHIADHGYAPTVAELADILGLASKSSVQGRLDVLEEYGLIERRGPRAIKVLT